MNVFVISYFATLIIASCLAAFYEKRSIFLTLFSLTLVSFVVGIVGGAGALQTISVGAVLLAFAAGVSYCFREFLVIISPTNVAKELKTAPMTAAFGMFIIFTYAIAGIFAPWIAPYGESEVISSAFAPADENMLLGADQLGRDMFSRIIFGARNTVGLALMATASAFFMGAFAGLLAATRGGWIDQFLGRFADVIMAIPSLIFALLMLSIFGPHVFVIIIAVAIIYAPRVFRLTRAVAGNVVVMDYIEAANLRGEKNSYLIRKEILPNVTAPLVAEFGLEFCFVFLLVAGLSFLGLGIQPPTADWGSMVRENATLISFGDITPLIPAGAIALLTVAVNFVVDWMLFRSSGLKE
ncbi:ABC transporter permease [Aliiroseovarius crassostreae]|uniref:ABC transporter permease n=1 Tax=Aliiroseovarius crassostreae TaxID=154981 RepID=A0A9Q9HB58_9RHOB|nr:ABC transporter permease [Aliiroseovarius crassostreae]UWP88850.1 ABC transporter permease [Aliiroseovarius crassostreae]UWP92008.1 ABC transporter permease [Aliiroseovarius crassostreae]UWP95157.1 ABC transporter permease [Aliiroseovarius crassostreae]UWP98314.1 ABC transporter permease [Aliiroseovarius crassostreae]